MSARLERIDEKDVTVAAGGPSRVHSTRALAIELRYGAGTECAFGSNGARVRDHECPEKFRARRAIELPELAAEHDASTFTTDAPFDAIVSRFGVMFFDDPW